MRRAKESDYWDKAYKRKYSDGLEKLNLNGLNNFSEITFAEGILVICGLNGAGKSTIISAIKDILGMDLTEGDVHKLKGYTIHGEFWKGTNKLLCSNEDTNRLSNKGIDIEKVRYLDCNESSKSQDFNVRQANLEELLEQAEEYELSVSEINEINYITGKKYSFCGIREFEDIEDIGTVLYFRVVIDEVEYDSRSMGSGEHFLFYLFWCINKCEKGTIFIIEEPETYISIYSQIHFSNYLGKQMAEKGIQIIMTTHSPYLLGHIKNEHIRIVSRMGNMVVVTKPNDNMTAESILGISDYCKGTLFVEDRVAHDFLAIILEDRAPYILKKYTIDIAVGGEKAITQRLEFPESEKIKYNFVGVYDGDLRERLDTSKLNWKWAFLPGNMPLEELYRNFLHDVSNISEFSTYFNRDQDTIITMLSTIDGNDYHDWFEELRKFLGVDGRALVRAFYNLMVELNDDIDVFVSSLVKCLE